MPTHLRIPPDKEDFPAPLGPKSAWIPGPNSKDTSRMATVEPYSTVMLSSN